MKSYPAYKPSGIDWFGDVPCHWEVRRLKNIASLLMGQSPSSDDCSDNPIGPPFLQGCAEFGPIHPDPKQYCKEPPKTAPCNSILMSVRAPVGRLNMADRSYGIGRGLCSISPYSEYADVTYTRYVLESSGDALTVVSTGSTYDAVSIGDVASHVFPLPPLAEQDAIVRYLDSAGDRIRRAISVKERLIELLTEQRQAVIHRAVTRGLDPNVRLKDSGAEWLGDMPAHWRKVRLKALLTRPLQNGLFKKKDQFGSGAPLINVADIYQEDFRVEASELEHVQVDPDEARRFQVQDGDVFFVRSSLKLEGTGRSAVAVNCSPDTVFECHLVGARPNRRLINPRFMAFQLNALAFREYLVSQANMVTMATIDQGTIACSALVIPPRSEQDKIVEWLDTRWGEITLAIDKAQRQIDLLREYRTRLIADVVTGQVDVRGAVGGEDELPVS